MLKERVKERLTESSGLPNAPGSASNSARWTPPGQEVELSIPQLAGGIQIERPVADNPVPADSVPDGPDTHLSTGKGAKYNNKIRRDPNGTLTASGMPGEAYASPAEYVADHEAQGENEATA